MASLRPVPFVINDDEDWGTLLAPPTSLSVHPSTTSSAVTGEFNAFSFVGAVISGGVPNDRCGFSKRTSARA